MILKLYEQSKEEIHDYGAKVTEKNIIEILKIILEDEIIKEDYIGHILGFPSETRITYVLGTERYENGILISLMNAPSFAGEPYSGFKINIAVTKDKIVVFTMDKPELDLENPIERFNQKATIERKLKEKSKIVRFIDEYITNKTALEVKEEKNAYNQKIEKINAMSIETIKEIVKNPEKIEIIPQNKNKTRIR